MNRRGVLIAAGAILLAGAFVATQIRFLSDSRSIQHPYAIETLKNRDDLKSNRNYVAAVLDALLAGKTPDVKSNQPYG